MAMEKMILLLDSARGQFIPRDFVTGFAMHQFIGISDSDILECQNPENADYWDAWQCILDNAKFVDGDRVFTLHHDGDLWLLCVAELSEGELSNFGFDNA